MKSACYLLFFMLHLHSSYAQKAIDFQLLDGVKKIYGIDKKVLAPAEWKAKWIWRRGETYASNVMLCARKTFELTAKPETARLFITADSHYTLWINGEFAGRGPARSAPHHQSYDIMDIAAKLKTGKNVLAIKVHHSGNVLTYNSTLDKVRPGLLFQLELGSGEAKTVLISDPQVKVRNEVGWDTKTPQVDGSNLARVENFDFNLSAPGWEKTDFNDSSWEKAVLIRPDVWPPRTGGEEDSARMFPWLQLVPRDLPYLEERFRPASAVFEVGECADFPEVARAGAVEQLPILGLMQHQVLPLQYCKVDNLNAFLQQKSDLKIQNFVPQGLYTNEPYRNAWLVFDMGELLLGYPSIEIDAPRGTNIDVSYAPFLIAGKFNPAIMPSNLGDRVVLPGGKIQWEAQELRTFRYLGIYVSNTEKPITISFAGVKQTYYPFKDAQHLKLADVMLEKLSKASDKTIRIVTHDAFTDNYRERKQYIQTAWYAAKGAYSLFGDPYLMRRLLVQHADDQLQSGFMPMHAPGKPRAGILEADFFWHRGLYDYYMYSGDEVTTRTLLVNLKRNLEALEDIQNKDGILDSPPSPYWIDHTTLDRRGINFTLNGWYALALEDDASLFKLLGDPVTAAKCTAKANKIKGFLKNNFWNKSKGLFAETIVDGKQTNSFDEISNGVALLLKIADDGQQRSIAEKIRTNDQTQEMHRPVLAMYWPVEGLFSAGYGKIALEILRSRYSVMMAHPEGTLWEGWNLFSFNSNGRITAKIRSAAQAEQVFHPDVFIRNLLGCTIIKPGARELQISYTGNNLKNMSGSVPTPSGDVKIDWVLEGTSKSLSIQSPKLVKIIVNRVGLPRDVKINQYKY